MNPTFNSMSARVTANISHLERFSALLLLIRTIENKAAYTSQVQCTGVIGGETKYYSAPLIERLKHQQALKQIPSLYAEVEPHLILLVESEKLLNKTMDYYMAVSLVKLPVDPSTAEDALQLLESLTEKITHVRQSLMNSIYAINPWQAQNLEQKYPPFEPVEQNTGTVNGVHNAHKRSVDEKVYLHTAKRYCAHQESAQEFECNEDMDVNYSQFSKTSVIKRG